MVLLNITIFNKYKESLLMPVTILFLCKIFLTLKTLRGEKLNYKSVAKEISKPPFLAPEVHWASKFAVFVRFRFSSNV